MSPAKILKSLVTKRFTIELYQLDSGKYCIHYENIAMDLKNYSEPVDDFIIARWLYDKKIQEVEGN